MFSEGDTLAYEDFDIQEALPGGSFFERSFIPGSEFNLIMPYKFYPVVDGEVQGSVTFNYEIKYLKLYEVLDADSLKFDQFKLLNYIESNIDSVNLGKHRVDFIIEYTNPDGHVFSNWFYEGHQLEIGRFSNTIESLNMTITKLDTIDIHGFSSRGYYRFIEIEADFDGYLFNQDLADSIHVTGSYRNPIYGGVPLRRIDYE